MTARVLTGFELTSTTDGERPGPDARWIPAVVPGGVHESLFATGQIGHPYHGDNEQAVRFDTNYLDLRPGDARTVEVSGLRPDAELVVRSYGDRAPS